MRTFIASLIAAAVLGAGFAPLTAEAARSPKSTQQAHSLQAKKVVKKKATKKVTKKAIKKTPKKAVKKVQKLKPHA